MFISDVVVRYNCNVQGVVQNCNVQGEQGGEKGLQGVKDVVQQYNVQGGVQQQRTLCGLLPDRRHRFQLHRPCQHLHVKPDNRPCE